MKRNERGMKTAVITGGNKGLGLAQTQRFVEEGYAVHVVARSRGDLDPDGPVTLHIHDLSD